MCEAFGLAAYVAALAKRGWHCGCYDGTGLYLCRYSPRAARGYLIVIYYDRTKSQCMVRRSLSPDRPDGPVRPAKLFSPTNYSDHYQRRMGVTCG